MLYSDHLFFSYFSNVLSKKFDSKIVGFYNFKLIVSKLKENLIEKIKWKLSNTINYNNFGVYRSFGTKEIFKPNIDKNIEKKSYSLNKKIIKNLRTKNDIYKIKINEHLLGDLIYDSYLKFYYLPTINIKDQKFKIFLYEFICLYLYWEKFFKEKSVKAILGVHAHYSYAIPMRIAFKKKYQCICIMREKYFT